MHGRGGGVKALFTHNAPPPPNLIVWSNLAPRRATPVWRCNRGVSPWPHRSPEQRLDKSRWYFYLLLFLNIILSHELGPWTSFPHGCIKDNLGVYPLRWFSWFWNSLFEIFQHFQSAAADIHELPVEGGGGGGGGCFKFSLFWKKEYNTPLAKLH